MNAAIGILTLLTLGTDSSPLRIESSNGGRVVTVVADFEEGQLPTQTSPQLTARQGEAILTFRLVDENGELGAPIFGEYRRAGSQIRFKPRYRLIPQYDYRATIHTTDGQSVILNYRVPKRPASTPASVEKLFPSSSVLPANHLKFYIYFSKPMREGRAIFDRIHLFNEDGTKVPDPWRRTELWTEDTRRLTLWIHPGRIKTGVNLREELGPVLQQHRRYTLVISPNMQDADGQRLGRRFAKGFETTIADRKCPQPHQWRLHLPLIATRQQLEVKFEESLDHALSQRFLEVRDSKRQLVAGQINVGELEACWSFVPNAPWANEEYRLVVNPLLEDLAGNTPNRIFDTDLTATAQSPSVLILPFHPRKSP